MTRTAFAPPSTKIEQQIVDTIKVLSIDAVQQAKSGHPGLPMGGADFATTLWTRHLRIDPAWPEWPGRDRFVLSAGHGSMLLYSMLHLAGFDLPLEELRRFRQWESRTPGHPEFGMTSGVETTTGPLGQGIGNAVGMALAERIVASRFPNAPDGAAGHRTFCFAGDGDMMEGVASEASSIAGHLGLARLVIWYDSNRITIDGSTDLSFSEDVGARYRAYGWHVIDGIDGHHRASIDEALRMAEAETDRPTLIVGHTTIAHGSPNLAGSSKTHGAPLGEEEIRLVKEDLGFDPDVSFHVPGEVREWFAGWREGAAEASSAWKAKRETYARDHADECAAWEATLAGDVSADLLANPPTWETGESVPTRKAGQQTLQVAAAELPGLTSGSADLFGSNLTEIAGAGAVTAGEWGGRNVYYGIREHGMASVMNGMALHGGIRPVGSTFLVFADYLRPALRLAALMELPVIHVFTHDSVWVGEDGPTHQPVEHLDSLRIIPGLTVVRPADARETVAAWRHALQRTGGPTVLLLSRQALPVIERPTGAGVAPDVGLAGVVYRTPDAEPRLVFVGTGSEVSLCCAAAEKLAAEGVPTQVVSVPCLEEFETASATERDALFGPGTPRLFVEAGPGATWGRWMQDGDAFHGIERFGASAPGAEVARHLGLDADVIADRARAMLA